MSKCPPYAHETRQQITKSAINKSTAKILWSFSKKQRFPQPKPVCPLTSYNYNLSTLSKRKPGFGSSKRRVFTQTSDTPTSWNYNPSKVQGYRPHSSFGNSRQKCTANSYLSHSVYKNPSPNQYQSSSLPKHKSGYSMRPKTAYQKTYFIQDKQQKYKPSPFQYNFNLDKDGKAIVSKYRTVTMGNAALQSKNERFKNLSFLTPSPNLYHPLKYGINKYSKNGKINFSDRKSFIDDVTKSQYTPGPGNYRLPTQFAHYTSYKHSSFSIS